MKLITKFAYVITCLVEKFGCVPQLCLFLTNPLRFRHYEPLEFVAEGKGQRRCGRRLRCYLRRKCELSTDNEEISVVCSNDFLQAGPSSLQQSTTVSSGPSAEVKSRKRKHDHDTVKKDKKSRSSTAVDVDKDSEEQAPRKRRSKASPEVKGKGKKAGDDGNDDSEEEEAEEEAEAHIGSEPAGEVEQDEVIPSEHDDDSSDDGSSKIPQHESLAKKKANTKKAKFVPEDETAEQRNARTIFVGNLPAQVAKSRVSFRLHLYTLRL